LSAARYISIIKRGLSFVLKDLPGDKPVVRHSYAAGIEQSARKSSKLPAI
jgi:hypothetical protein